MRRRSLLCLLVALAAACKGSDAGWGRPRAAEAHELPPRAVPAGGGAFVLRTVREGGVDYRYQVFVPRGFDPARPWPVVLFLHGSSERGSDGDAQTRAGLGPTVRAQAATFPAVVVFPQGPRIEGGAGHVLFGRLALRALDQSVAEFHGDPKRVYLAGFSMGTKIGYELASAHPDRFAAFVAVSGDLCVRCLVGNDDAQPDSLYRAVVGAMGPLPMWIFHGSADPSVPVAHARRVVAVRRAMGAPVRYTEYPGAGHGIWGQAFATPDLWPWLLAQHR